MYWTTDDDLINSSSFWIRKEVVDTSKVKKVALDSRLQAIQILTNNVQVQSQ